MLFGETINTSNFIHSSIADFRGLTIANTVPERKKQKIDYVVGLRKNLHSIDLNESEENEKSDKDEISLNDEIDIFSEILKFCNDEEFNIKFQQKLKEEFSIINANKEKQ